MKIEKIAVGKNPPHEVNVIIEIAGKTEPIKYEYDYEGDIMIVDRIQENSMQYPHSYGFIPHTKCDDGDAMDVMVICKEKLQPGVLISVRPIGVLRMEDDGGLDNKIIAVPTVKVSKYYSKVNELQDLPESMLKEIEFFFSRYKDTEAGKWTKVSGFGDAQEARNIILESIIK